jgi:hypothetical protein
MAYALVLAGSTLCNANICTLCLLQMLHTDALPQSILADITRIIVALNAFNSSVDYNTRNMTCRCLHMVSL